MSDNQYQNSRVLNAQPDAQLAMELNALARAIKSARLRRSVNHARLCNALSQSSARLRLTVAQVAAALALSRDGVDYYPFTMSRPVRQRRIRSARLRIRPARRRQSSFLPQPFLYNPADALLPAASMVAW